MALPVNMEFDTVAKFEDDIGEEEPAIDPLILEVAAPIWVEASVGRLSGPGFISVESVDIAESAITVVESCSTDISSEYACGDMNEIVKITDRHKYLPGILILYSIDISSNGRIIHISDH